MHPLLKPAIWIGEVLHSSPGPAIEFNGGDFMPISFLVGNVAVIGLLAFNKRLSGALNVLLLGLFINFVGLGLEGELGSRSELRARSHTLTTHPHTQHQTHPHTLTVALAPIPAVTLTLTLTLVPTQARSTTVSITSRSTTASKVAPRTKRWLALDDQLPLSPPPPPSPFPPSIPNEQVKQPSMAGSRSPSPCQPQNEQVKQPSMADFDVKKYTGRWYEHAFHDYTQFSDVYDTTLDIELSADSTRWLDDFALRGPSPKAQPIP